MAPRVPVGEVIAVGDEIVQGWATDTNSGEIARALAGAGVRVVRTTAVGDEREAIAQCMRETGARAEVVIVTGGLGPTDDDLTREGAADALGVELESVPALWDAIVERLRRRGRAVPESNRRQAARPRGAESIANALGTAPGFSFRLGSARFFALPGVPHEMRAMLAEHVVPEISRAYRDAAPFVRRTVVCFGAPEAVVGEAIAPWMGRRSDPLVGITVSRGVHTISVLAQDDGVSPRSGAERAEAAAAAIAAKLGDLVVSRDGAPLEAVVGEMLRERGLTIALAESCTGGLATALLTAVPGISAVLRESFVVYANEAKQARLGVSEELLRTHGAVSRECAVALARGARAAAGAGVAVSITGIAGPEGGTPEKPVGLVWIALDGPFGTRVQRRDWAGLERNLLREITARDALDLVRLALLGKEPGERV